MKKQKMWDCILLDFDYTIVDSSAGIIECFNRSFKELGLPICTAEDIANTIGLSLSDAYTSLQQNQDKTLADKFIQLFHKASGQIMVNSATMYPGVEDFFKWTREQGFMIGIVTSKDALTVNAILRKYGCENYVDVVIGEDEVTLAKPAAEPINTAIGKLHANKSSTVYIGDCLADAEAAYNAQVDFIAVLTGCTRKEEFLNCNCPVLSIYKDINAFWEYMLGSVSQS